MVDLSIEDIHCYYGSVKVLEDIRFSVKSGDFVGILGPNGSGKTTLLSSISRTLRPRKGRILIDDIDVYSLSSTEAAKQMAVVPQETIINFNFTVIDIVLMGRNPYISRFEMESEKDLEIARRCMEFTKTSDLAQRRVRELSGGEKQRVIVARALAQEPKILLLDEPTTHLDINNQLEIMDLIKTLCRHEKLAVLGVFHDFNLAARYCDRCILINSGRMIDQGSIHEVLTPENVEKVFNVRSVVHRHPIAGSIHIVGRSKPAMQMKDFSVHLVCGGGTGFSIMARLLDSGYRVTAGILHADDADNEAAKSLGIPVVTEASFSQFTEDHLKANFEWIEASDLVVVTGVPFGQTNLPNLELVRKAVEKGKRVVVIREPPFEERDFTGGKAGRILKQIVGLGAVLADDPVELIETLPELGNHLNKEEVD
jgi:iron complex transport system ATP-binding protein